MELEARKRKNKVAKRDFQGLTISRGRNQGWGQEDYELRRAERTEKRTEKLERKGTRRGEKKEQKRG